MFSQPLSVTILLFPLYTSGSSAGCTVSVATMLGAALLDDDGSYSSTIGFINDNNSSTTAATYQHLAVKLQSCSEWEKSQHGLFQAANCLYAASLFIPHHTFRWTISIGRIMTGLAHLLFSLWACLILCSPDVFAWHCLMTLTTSVHVVYWTWQFRPFRARIRPPLLELYQKLFLPLDASPDLFVLLINKSVIRNLEPGDEYFTTFDPAHSMRLSFLLTGKYVQIFCPITWMWSISEHDRWWFYWFFSKILCSVLHVIYTGGIR